MISEVRNPFYAGLIRGVDEIAGFAANDMMALGVLWAAHNYGLRAPTDLAVIGLDDIVLAAESPVVDYSSCATA